MNERQIVPLPKLEAALTDVKHLLNMMRELREHVLVEGVDYGTIPGTEKPSLWQPGMEKMMRELRVKPRYSEECIIRDYDKALFHYEYKCELVDVDTLQVIPGAEAIGLCSSKESKYGFRWVNRDQVPPNVNADELQQRNGTMFEFAFAVDKAETTGKYGKPAEYWQVFKDAIANGTALKVQKETKNKKMYDGWEIGGTQYRIPNPDIFDQINTICKMAQKRALGSAVKGAACVSEYFTVDLEDLERYDIPITVSVDDGRSVDTVTGEVQPAAPAPVAPPASVSSIPQEENPLLGNDVEGEPPIQQPSNDPALATLKEVVATDGEPDPLNWVDEFRQETGANVTAVEQPALNVFETQGVVINHNKKTNVRSYTFNNGSGIIVTEYTREKLRGVVSDDTIAMLEKNTGMKSLDKPLRVHYQQKGSKYEAVKFEAAA